MTDMTERNATMRRLRIAEGLSLQEIADRYGITRERVRQLVGPCAVWSSTRRANERGEKVKALLAQGVNAREIARQLGCSASDIYNDIRRLGLKTQLSDRKARGVRRCGNCKEEKPVSEFSRNCRLCRPCNAIVHRRWYWRTTHGSEPPAEKLGPGGYPRKVAR